MDETDLLQRARAGDGEAFGRLVDPHLRRLRTAVALRAPAAHLIDEIAHEAVVFAFEHLEDFRGGDLGPWLRGIAWTLLRAEIQRFARRRVQLSRYAQEVLSRAEPPGEDADEVDRLRGCLDRLPLHQRELIDQRYREALDAETMAERLGRSAEWVRTNLYRLRARLRDCMEASA